MTQFTKRKVEYRRCSFVMKSQYDPSEYRLMLDNNFYYKYPFMYECTLLAILTPKELITNIPLNELPVEYEKKRHTEFYEKFKNDYGPFYYEELGLLIEQPEVDFAVIDYVYENRKLVDGTILPMTAQYCIPINFLMVKQFEAKFRTSINSDKRIEQVYFK